MRHVTEYLLPALRCQCCGAVTTAAPTGAQPGSVSYGPVLNTAAVLLTAYGNVPPERAAPLTGMLLETPVSAGFADKASARLPRKHRGKKLLGHGRIASTPRVKRQQ